MKIVLLGGLSAAGKSTLSSKLSDKYGLYEIKHQDVVHKLATDSGHQRARFWLSAIGQDEFMRYSLLEMIDMMQNHPEGSVVDVVYNAKMVSRIREDIPEAEIKVVYVDTPREVRILRIMGRMKEQSTSVAEKELNFRDNFLKIAGAEELKNNCDYLINNLGDIDEMVGKIVL